MLGGQVYPAPPCAYESHGHTDHHSFIFIYPYGWGGGKRPKDGQLVVPTQSSERYDMRKKTRNRTKKKQKKRKGRKTRKRKR